MQLVPELVCTVNLERQSVDLLKFLYENNGPVAEWFSTRLLIGVRGFDPHPVHQHYFDDTLSGIWAAT
jgi:hypothetical protein